MPHFRMFLLAEARDQCGIPVNRLRKLNASVWTLVLLCLLAACAGGQTPPEPAATGNPTPLPALTHYGHAEAGRPIVFKFWVEMLYELPDEVIRCGLQVGMIRFPRRGPIPNVSMEW